jgi:hypothetical protein
MNVHKDESLSKKAPLSQDNDATLSRILAFAAAFL